MLVSSSRVEVELGRLLWVLRAEDDLFVGVDILAVLVLTQPATAYVESLAVAQGILLAVDNDNAVAAGIDDAQLTVAHEVVGTQLRMGLQLQVLGDRHGATIDEAVVHGVSKVDFVGGHDLLHDETIT